MDSVPSIREEALLKQPSRKDLDRFWSRIDRSQGDEKCWIWSGCSNLNFWFQGNTVDARRFCYVLHMGAIPREMKLVSVCKEAMCVNCAHVELRRKGNGLRHDRKFCSDCGIEKPLTEFGRCRTGALGRYNYCKPCFRDRKRREYHGKKSDGTHRAVNLARYGVTVEDYERMVKEQDGKCAICERRLKRSLAVDHDHSSGRVRQLLCDACNAGIGMFRDDPQVMLRAIAYVRKWNEIISSST